MKILKSIYNLIFIVSVIFFSTAAISSENQLNDYYKTIRCLVCDVQSIQESDTEFAINLKEQIKKKFDNGITLKEVNKELVSIYGEKISFTPSKNHILLWMFPIIVLILFIFFIRRKYKYR
jgi:cytochrome c-type biogenesis protein CcmH